MKKCLRIIAYILCVLLHLIFLYCGVFTNMICYAVIGMAVTELFDSMYVVTALTWLISLVTAYGLANVTVFPLWVFPSKGRKSRIKRHFILSGIYWTLIILPWVFTMIDAVR